MSATSDRQLGEAVIGLVLFVPLLVLNGWVAHKVWLWLAVPLFAAPALSVGQCVAIGALRWVFLPRQQVKDDETVMVVMLEGALYSVVTLGIVWCITQAVVP